MRNENRFHHIQKSIILSLASKSPARFSELQPPRVPNNTFSYHLKKLLDGDYIELTDRGYTATRKALKLVAFSNERRTPISSPTTMSMICVTNDDDEILLISRENKPFQGWYSMPTGPINLGESLQEAARRELHEKTTLQTTEDLQQVGVLDYRYVDKESGDIFVHVIAFIYTYHYKGDKQALNDAVTKYGQMSWSNLGRSHILPEVFAIKKLVDSGEFTQSSVNFVEPSHVPIFMAGKN
jgi:ADP-ribose pyrophosphatase YjhB (NUDIX family)